MALRSFRPFRIDTIVSAFRRLRFQSISSSLVRPKNLPQFAMEGVWYDLPDEQIAKHPVPRGQSRLLLVHPPDKLYEGDKPIQLLQDRKFQDVIDLLPAGAHLVVNESRVFEARMWAIPPKEGNIPIEVMLLAPEQRVDQADGGKHSISFDPSLALQGQAHGQIWRAMVRTVVKEGDTLEIIISSSNKSKKAFIRVAQVFSPWEEENEPLGTEVAIELLCNSENRDELPANDTMSQFVARVGDIPIPPYLNRESTALDRTGLYCAQPWRISCMIVRRLLNK